MFILLVITILILCLVVLLSCWQQTVRSKKLEQQLAQSLQQSLLEKLNDNQLKSLQSLHDGLQKGREELNSQLRLSLEANAKVVSQRVEKLTDITEKKLLDISGQVEKRLNEGFEKTNQTFADILKRLALIDQAQQKISELSSNVVSLQELLNDKRSRGAFGEVQLSALIRNMLPENHFSFQQTLSNDKRPDCLLYLPKPTGNMVVDAKFPLESYQRLTAEHLAEADRRLAEQQFRQDIKYHIHSIANKYIIPGETADGAIMFIPAEAVFAEIHAHYPDLVEASHRAKVWLTSPTTMMAVLTTIRAVLKDDATRKQVSVIQQHLQALAIDFGRFQKRMDGLERHIAQANEDVRNVNISAKKITSRFGKIEQVELEDQEAPLEQQDPIMQGKK